MGGADVRADGSGLSGLADRVGAVGGTLSVASPRGGGYNAAGRYPAGRKPGSACEIGVQRGIGQILLREEANRAAAPHKTLGAAALESLDVSRTRGPPAAVRRAATASPSPSGRFTSSKHRIGTDRAGKNQRLGAAAGFPHNLVAPSGEKAKGRRAKRWIIVDDQDLYSRLPADAVIGGHLLRIPSTERACNGASPRLTSSGTRARRVHVGAVRAEGGGRACRRSR